MRYNIAIGDTLCRAIRNGDFKKASDCITNNDGWIKGIDSTEAGSFLSTEIEFTIVSDNDLEEITELL
jgi:hypothetical protein